MEMIIDFPGGSRVDAHFGGFTIATDQPPQLGGEASAPTPFATFLAALGTCAGIYVLGFCKRRGIDTAGMRLVQRVAIDPESKIARRVELAIELPAGFPEQYRAALVRAAEQCLVKKQLEQPPEFAVTTASQAPDF